MTPLYSQPICRREVRPWLLHPRLALVGVLVFFSLMPVINTARSGPGRIIAPSPVQDEPLILVPINKSRIVDLRTPVARVSVANPAICDIVVVNPRQIYLVGKQLGTTNMTLWDDQDQVKEMLGLEVTHDLQSLKHKLYQMLPGEEIRVQSSQGALVLSGEVSSAPKMAAALQIAEQFALPAESQARIGLPGKGQKNVINLMQVGGAQQVLLEVKVAEMSRNLSKTMDIDFAGLYNGGDVKMGLISSGADIPIGILPLASGGTVYPGGIVPGVSGGNTWTVGGNDLLNSNIESTGAVAGVLAGNFFFNVVLDIAQAEGLAKILAEPNLTTLSGQEADFISGGSFPIQTVNENGEPNIQYQRYGIQLNFVPTVLDSGLINLHVAVTVSEPDEETSTEYGLGLRQRGANSTVEIPSGQTLAIAGLLSESLTSGIDKFPGLGDLPIFGALFRSQAYRKRQTELMIFVTPRLARPFDTELVKLPTDHFVEPSDTEFYLMGKLEGQRRKNSGQHNKLGPDKSGSEGVFGHDL
jgi:pilus assembly protein CpaC